MKRLLKPKPCDCLGATSPCPAFAQQPVLPGRRSSLVGVRLRRGVAEFAVLVAPAYGSCPSPRLGQRRINGGNSAVAIGDVDDLDAAVAADPVGDDEAAHRTTFMRVPQSSHTMLRPSLPHTVASQSAH